MNKLFPTVNTLDLTDAKEYLDYDNMDEFLAYFCPYRKMATFNPNWKHIIHRAEQHFGLVGQFNMLTRIAMLISPSALPNTVRLSVAKSNHHDFGKYGFQYPSDYLTYRNWLAESQDLEIVRKAVKAVYHE